jgi:UDP-N-acetylmuramate dehydrogenase
MQDKLISAFPELIDKAILKFDVPMADHTSFKIGGPADAFCSPSSIKDMVGASAFLFEGRNPIFHVGKRQQSPGE